jgi:hypothetical protein
MADFQKLDPETRAFALVGQFLQAWSTMENSLHDAIGAALSIDAPKLKILCANIRLRDKIDILRTLIDIAPGFATEEKTQLKKSLRDIAEYSVIRNMLAHDSFRPDSAGAGVEFLTVKAKGKFELPNVIWSADRFQQEGKTVVSIGLYSTGFGRASRRGHSVLNHLLLVAHLGCRPCSRKGFR